MLKLTTTTTTAATNMDGGLHQLPYRNGLDALGLSLPELSSQLPNPIVALRLCGGITSEAT